MRLDIYFLIRSGVIHPGETRRAKLSLPFYPSKASMNSGQLDVQSDAHVSNARGELRLRYSMTDFWTGQKLEIDDTIHLTATCPMDGVLKWFFVCPRSSRRVRTLYLPLGASHFWSRSAYRLGYLSQRESTRDRAIRQARKLCDKLGGKPFLGNFPPRPKRMRWKTYEDLIARIAAAEGIALARLGHTVPRSIQRLLDKPLS